MLQKEFYSLDTWFAPPRIESGSVFDFYGVQYFYCLLRIIIYILPTLVLLFFTKPERNFNLLVFIFFVYFISLFLGAPITNIYPYIILLPIMLLINSYAFKNIKGER